MSLKNQSGGHKGDKQNMRRGAVVDGIAITDMTKEQLESHIYNLQNEIEKERNYYQVERDKICAFWNITKGHLKDKEAELQVKDKKLEEAQLALLAEIKEHNKELATMRQEYEGKRKVLKNKLSEFLNVLTQELDEAKNKEIQEIEESKNRQIKNLTKNHEKLFGDMMNYYNDITKNNMSLIATMKDQIETSSKKEKRFESEAEIRSRENEFLSRQLREMKKESSSLQKKVEYFKREKGRYIDQIKTLRKKEKHLESEAEIRSRENELLSRQLREIEEESSSLQKKVESFFKREKDQYIVNDDLLRAVDRISFLGLVNRPSGPHTGMSQRTFKTAPSTRDTNQESVP